MVERRRGPTIRAMAGSTLASQAFLVDVLCRVTGIAILRGGFELRQAAVMNVAQCALHLGMFPGQLENYTGMVEIGSMAVHTIMAGQAVAAIILGVGLYKGCFNPGVAGSAGGLVETGVALHMAISAIKWRTIAVGLVGGH